MSAQLNLGSRLLQLSLRDQARVDGRERPALGPFSDRSWHPR